MLGFTHLYTFSQFKQIRFQVLPETLDIIVFDFFSGSGNGFHNIGAAFWKDLPPNFNLFVSSTDGSFRRDWELERRLLVDICLGIDSARYSGAKPFKQLNVRLKLFYNPKISVLLFLFVHCKIYKCRHLYCSLISGIDMLAVFYTVTSIETTLTLYHLMFLGIYNRYCSNYGLEILYSIWSH